MADIQDMDFRILFDGRTVVVELTHATLMDPKDLSERVRKEVAGPLLRMTCGGLWKSEGGLLLLTKTFVNTDEDLRVVHARVTAMKPMPEKISVGLCDPEEAAGIWRELARAQGN